MGEYVMVVVGVEKGIYDLREMVFEIIESMVCVGKCIFVRFCVIFFVNWDVYRS